MDETYELNHLFASLMFMDEMLQTPEGRKTLAETILSVNRPAYTQWLENELTKVFWDKRDDLREITEETIAKKMRWVSSQ